MSKPKITEDMSWEEQRKVIQELAADKKEVYRDFKKQYKTKKGKDRIKLILDYTYFSAVEEFGHVAEYDLMDEFLKPVGKDGKVDQEESKKRMSEVISFLHEEIYKPFLEYVKQNPNHSDNWYQDHFPLDTDAGKYWMLLQPALNNVMFNDLNEMMARNEHLAARSTGKPGEIQTKPGIFGDIERETAKYVNSLKDPAERRYIDYAIRTIKPIKSESAEIMQNPRTRRIYKKQQKALEAKEQQDAANKQGKNRIQDWMEFGRKLDTSFITNKRIKKEYQERVTKDLQYFKDFITIGELQEHMDRNPAQPKKNEHADQPKELHAENTVLFSEKKTEDILEVFDDLKEIHLDPFNGYPPEKNAEKPEDTDKLESFVDHLLDLKSSARLSMTLDDQKLYNSVIKEFKKAQDPTVLHEYLRKRTMESLAEADGNLLILKNQRNKSDHEFHPAINKAIEYYALYKEITGEELRKKYQKDARAQIRGGCKDAMQALTSDETELKPFAKTLQALQQAAKNGEKDDAVFLLKYNQDLFNSSLLAPFMEGTKLVSDKIRMNDPEFKKEEEARRLRESQEKKRQEEARRIQENQKDIRKEVGKRQKAVKEAKAVFDPAKDDLFVCCNNLKLAVDDMKETSSRKDSKAYREMMKAIDALRPEKNSGFFETLRKASQEDMNKKIAYAAQKVDDYLTHAAGKKWYNMLPGSTGKIRYRAAMEVKQQLQNIPTCRKEYDKALGHLNDMKKELKNAKEYQNLGDRVPLSKREIDAMMKPRAQEAPVQRRPAMKKAAEKTVGKKN